MMRIRAGWLDGVRQVPSCNFNLRPAPLDISLIVIHCISLPPTIYNTPYVDDLFTYTLDPKAHPYFEPIAKAELSAHIFIKRDGLITQYVSFLDRAYHAGRSSYQGRDECNDYSIGIELEGCVSDSYTAAQYSALNEIIAVLRATYPKIKHNIASHSQIAPTRKDDPGPYFDYTKLLLD